MTDYEISKKFKLKRIDKIAKKLGLKDNEVELYGNYKAKINKIPNNIKSKLILVTSTNPTPFGEGKTTFSIGLCDAMNKNKEKTILALREPSLGPVFGIKGGATGGGLSQIMPSTDINLHFNGDFHAITSANNLIASIIDNHIYFGNELQIQEVLFQRCLDLNDRALRNVTLKNRKDHFTITAASELMMILCLAKNEIDLREKIKNIIIGINKDKKYVYLKDLKCEGAVLALLKDTLKPNLVQTLYNNPAIIHGGPFANIAHGCNSIIATKLAMSLADYTITEAGFGSDMGALKFLDIKCRDNNIYPDLIIITSTIRSLKHNGEGLLEKGIENLRFHIEKMIQANDNVLVVLNRFKDDKEEEIKYVKEFCEKLNTPFAISNIYNDGVNDTKELVKTVTTLANNKNTKHLELYKDEDDIITKIENICKNFLTAKEVKYKKGLKQELENLNKDFKNYKICISKTQYSITDNPKLLGYPKDFTITITDYKINNGAKIITILAGDIQTMPGLAKNSNYLNIDVKNEEIIGII